MRLGKTIGTVTLSQSHATFRGGVLRIVVPLSAANLREGDGQAEAGQFPFDPAEE